MSLLHMAALSNRVESAQALIKAGAPLNDVDKHGYTPLLYASTVDFGDERMVNLLLRSGADPKARAKTGETPLSQAKRYKYPHIRAVLSEKGVKAGFFFSFSNSRIFSLASLSFIAFSPSPGIVTRNRGNSIGRENRGTVSVSRSE